ncbi:hypothetical protein [uncultured Eubacterium sp.]|uniref:hypothetical protein n=1 Tax=uncultured Eubacterium sp. TaxID=165185 RepID=UPI002671172F|nr:hypothetical protein [uncultured Eubacterium sp.]
MKIIFVVLLVGVMIKCIFNKIAFIALSMYVKEKCGIPTDEELKAYTNRAIRKYFHITK